jgi:uncharacterized protein
MGAAIRYFVIVFILTWACWFAASDSAGSFLPHAPSPALKSVLIDLGVFMPGIVALLATWYAHGWRGAVSLLARLIRWRVGWQWYAFAVLFMPAVKLAAAAIYRVEYGRWPLFGHEQILLMLAATVLSVVLAGQVGEELGWRGYALPRLSKGVGLASASIMLGIVWACWHLPLFYLFPKADTFGQSFPLYLAQTTALSIAIAWLWWRTNGSLLLTMLFHAAVNNLKDIVPSTALGAANALSFNGTVIGWLTVGVLWIAALFFLLQMLRNAGRFAAES